jgi:2-oxoglutarate ferredoxin oxidoreductase subunit gamma
MKKSDIFKVLISGEGGQGVQSIGKIIAQCAFNKGLQTVYLPNFGPEQRGGVSIAYVQISQNKVVYPKFGHADLILVFSSRAFDRIKDSINKETEIIVNSYFVKEVSKIGKYYFVNPFVDLKNLKISDFKKVNMVMLGAALRFLPLEKYDISKVLKKIWEKKFSLQQIKENIEAIELGIKLNKK